MSESILRKGSFMIDNWSIKDKNKLENLKKLSRKFGKIHNSDPATLLLIKYPRKMLAPIHIRHVQKYS